jgi:hypothetical protein
MLKRFAPDAELRFENVAAGPFSGLEAIRAAYREQPPDDEIALLGIQDDGEHTITAAFAWLKGGTGRLVLEHERGLVTRLVVIFDRMI